MAGNEKQEILDKAQYSNLMADLGKVVGKAMPRKRDSEPDRCRVFVYEEGTDTMRVTVVPTER